MFPTDLTEDYKRKYPLHAALLLNDLNIIKQILRNGHAVNKKDDRDRTPLHFAIEHVNKVDLLQDACKLLLDHGADVNCRDFDKRTPLHCMYDCCIRKKVNDDGRLLDLLIKKNANVNARSRYGEMPLYLAVEADNVKAAKKLLESGALLNNVKCRSESIFKLAVKKRNIKMIQVLLSFNVNVEDASALSAMVQTNNVKILRLILEYGVLVSNKNCLRISCFRPMIDSVIERRDPDFIESLLENEYWRMILSRECVDIVTNNTSILHIAYNSEYIRLSNSNNPSDKDEFAVRVKQLEVILKHIAILKELGDISIYSLYINFIAMREPLRNGFEKYIKRLKIMKNTFVRKGSTVTYFDLLSKCGKPLMECCDEETVSVLTTNVEKLFPNFADKIMRNVRRGLFERRTREDTMQMLYEIFEFKLPFELMRNICEHLEIKDLKKFIVPVNVWFENYF